MGYIEISRTCLTCRGSGWVYLVQFSKHNNPLPGPIVREECRDCFGRGEREVFASER